MRLRNHLLAFKTQDIERRLDECEHWMLRLWKKLRHLEHDWGNSLSAEAVRDELRDHNGKVQCELDDLKKSMKAMKNMKAFTFSFHKGNLFLDSKIGDEIRAPFLGTS